MVCAALATWLAPSQVQGVRENLFRLPRLKRAAELVANADLVACTGIFDYLPTGDAVAMLRFFTQALAHSGHAIVFNFAPQNPTRAYMEWIGNWYLIYRDEAALRELAHAAGIATEKYQLAADATGIDLYLDVRAMSAFTP